MSLKMEKRPTPDDRSHSSGSAQDPEKGAHHLRAENAGVPDGGRRAWSVLFGIWLMQFCTFGYINAFGVYNDFYVRTYLSEFFITDWTHSYSWIGSTQLFLLSFCGLVAGRAYDTGYFYHMTIGGSVLFVFCLFMLSLARPGQYYQVFLTQGLGVGLACGMCYVPSLALVSQYFHRRIALAMGIAASAAAIGGALHPIMLNQLFNESIGFQRGVRTSAGLCGFLFLLSLSLMRQRVAPIKNDLDMLRMVRTFATDMPFVFMTLAATFNYAGLYYPVFVIQLNAIKNGITPHLAFYMIVILNGSSVVGRIVPTLFVPRIGVFNVTIACIWIAVILIFCNLAVKNAEGTIIYAIMYGFFSGSYASLITPLIASTVDDISEIGARIGLCYAVSAFGGLIGPPIAGVLLTTSFIWWKPFLFAGLCVAVSNIFYMTARHFYSKKKSTPWL